MRLLTWVQSTGEMTGARRDLLRRLARDRALFDRNVAALYRGRRMKARFGESKLVSSFFFFHACTLQVV